MMAKILLPLLLIGAAVADDEISGICQDLVNQFNNLQALAPLEVDVVFPHSSTGDFITGHAKFRIVSQLSLPDNGCSVTSSDDRTSRQVSVRVNAERAYIMSPTRVLHLNVLAFNVELDVKESRTQKAVTLSDFYYSAQTIYQDVGEVPLVYKTYINNNLKSSLTKELRQKLSYTFDVNNRIEIESDLVKQLVQDVYLDSAQDL